MNRGIIAEIDLKAVSNNLGVVKSLSNNRPVIAVVKADAYGHGAVEISRRLVSAGAEYLAVAFTEEAKELREAGIKAPILVLFDPDIGDVFKYSLTPVICNIKTAVALSKEAEKNKHDYQYYQEFRHSKSKHTLPPFFSSQLTAYSLFIMQL
ncbi:MAG: alanine racemase [Nitrospirae bacterium]|nr:alanine racemase [Nitrospirota bacterium]